MERVLISTQVWQQPSPSPSSSELYGCEVAVSPDLWQAILEELLLSLHAQQEQQHFVRE
jgi:hypothetical protein